MDNKFNVSLATYSQIDVVFDPFTMPSKRPKIRTSDDANYLLRTRWLSKSMMYKEEFRVLYLDRGNGVIGFEVHSRGSDTGTIVSSKQILAIALKCNASGIILAHNHPSGQMRPSQPDLALTKKIKEGCKLFDIMLLDHLILVPEEGFYSFADEGML